MPDKKYVNIYEFCKMKVAIGDAKAAVVDDSQKAYQVAASPAPPYLIPTLLTSCCQDAFEISKSKMQPTHPIR